MEKQLLTIRSRYTLGGVLFGLSFPLFSIFVDCLLNGQPFNWDGIVAIHQMNVIHYVVDTAPIVLGGAGFLLGRSYQKKHEVNERLYHINQSLDTFTYKITHDLRSPAINIKGLVDILKKPDMAAQSEQRDLMLDKLDQSVSIWMDTFKDFVELLKKEKSGIRDKEHCHLDQVVENVEQELNLEIESSQATIITDFANCKSVYASISDLNSIFKNLLTNAMKYTPSERKPEITIAAEKNHQEVKIKVRDNGIGIDLEKHGDSLFKLFKRLSNNSDIDGSGVGLYLVKDQVEKNNGSIEIESIVGQGSCFTVTLPLRRS